MNILLIIAPSLLLGFTLMPMVKQDYWTFRVFDYPRLQKLALSLCCLIFLLINIEYEPIYLVFTILLSLNVCYLLFLIWPFTPVSKKQVRNVMVSDPENQIRLIIANVLQDNRNFSGCLALIRKADPDVVLLLETDRKWDESTRSLEERYPHHCRVPMENTYGMLLYARFPIHHPNVHYLVEDDVPSIHCELELKSGERVQFYAVHPTPPVPNENPRSTERDKELMLVADLAKASKLPVIVAGDLNDVAWSYTTKLFLKMSGLLDPRRGRGFFNTFHAHYVFMRFPLDHAFCSPDFKLKSIQRTTNFGSDHFSMCVHLQYEPSAEAEQEPMEADAEDVEEAREKKAAVT